MKRAFMQVDVFGAAPYAGNPLAVVLDGADLSVEQMQNFARWTHLSETCFLLPPTDPAADYRVRIFTPGAELPFAGHPTLGSCHAWLEAGGLPKQDGLVVQQCEQGLVPIRRGTRLAFAAPKLKRSVVPDELQASVSLALGLDPAQIVAAQWLDNGPHWLGLLLDSAHRLLALAPDHAALKQLGCKVGVAAIEKAAPAPALIARSNREARAFGERSSGSDDAAPALHVRAFAAPVGVNEDPVTGSLNASLAQWLIADGHMPENYLAAQGQCVGCDGLVHITRDAQGQVWVGGDVATCIRGEVTL